MDPGAEMRRFSGFGAVLRRRAELLQMVGLAAVALTLYLYELGKGALRDWDEAIYAEVTKEMLQGRHWLTPYWNHHPFFEKPPLLFWAQMLPFHWLGMNAFAARLPSAVAGVGTVVLVYAMTRRMAGRAAGAFAGFVLLTTRFFDRSARDGTTDALLVMLIYLTVYGYVRLREGDGRWFYLMCAALALGIMTKGPAALVAPMAIGLDWGFRSEKKLVTARQFWLGMGLLAAIAAPWHVWMVSRFGWKYVNDYLGYQILARASRPLEGNTGGLLYYFRVIWYGALPWCLLGVWALVRWAWKREWKYALPWALMGVTLGLYTMVETKLQWYILPLYPALAMEVGRLLATWSRKWRLAGYAAVLAIAIGIGVAFDHLVRWPGEAVANQERALALVAKEKAGQNAQRVPVIVVGKPGLAPALDIRTAMFYSSRDVVWQQLPEHLKKLEAAVKEYRQVDVMMEKSTAQTLGQWFVVQPIADAGDTELARVSRKP